MNFAEAAAKKQTIDIYTSAVTDEQLSHIRGAVQSLEKQYKIKVWEFSSPNVNNAKEEAFDLLSAIGHVSGEASAPSPKEGRAIIVTGASKNRINNYSDLLPAIDFATNCKVPIIHLDNPGPGFGICVTGLTGSTGNRTAFKTTDFVKGVVAVVDSNDVAQLASAIDQAAKTDLSGQKFIAWHGRSEELDGKTWTATPDGQFLQPDPQI